MSDNHFGDLNRDGKADAADDVLGFMLLHNLVQKQQQSRLETPLSAAEELTGCLYLAAFFGGLFCAIWIVMELFF